MRLIRHSARELASGAGAGERRGSGQEVRWAISTLDVMTGTGYSEHQPDRTEVDTLPGATLLVFGTDWCGYCRTAERPMRDA